MHPFLVELSIVLLDNVVIDNPTVGDSELWSTFLRFTPGTLHFRPTAPF